MTYEQTKRLLTAHMDLLSQMLDETEEALRQLRAVDDREQELAEYHARVQHLERVR